MHHLQCMCGSNVLLASIRLILFCNFVVILIMEESNAPQEWNSMFSNVENNFAPWKFSPDERDKWTNFLILKRRIPQFLIPVHLKRILFQNHIQYLLQYLLPIITAHPYQHNQAVEENVQ